MKSGVHAGLSSRRSRVQIPSSPPKVPRWHLFGAAHGQVAQSVERCSEKAEVDGSMPSLATRLGASVWTNFGPTLASSTSALGALTSVSALLASTPGTGNLLAGSVRLSL